MTLTIHLVETWMRDPEFPCELFEEGSLRFGLIADCETDGHYLCRGCVHNIHRVPDHICRHDPCYFPELLRRPK